MPAGVPASGHARAWLAAAMLVLSSHAGPAAAERPSLRDPTDGAFDLSALLDTAYGFVPIVSPITEPAVGYGAAGALVFIDRNAPDDGKPVRPNIAAVGGFATENGTDGLFGGHVGHWLGGRLRTVAALADADVNLEFFGLGDRSGGADAGLDYTIGASGGVLGASYRPWSAPVWIGTRYVVAETDVRLRDAPLEGLVDPADMALRLAALAATVTFDSRDNSFTPTRGFYLDASMPWFRDGFGSDRDFELLDLSAQYFHPLADRWFGGVRAGWRDSSDGTPFYLRPYVGLRGVQAMRYQGEEVAEVEAELRFQ
ncbi:MAG TPA: BamA/TamA family outer membrane protein, partial [Steroidobacteraceae bacterium]|nr:BamA/TamA family outer membrane protein [Steroidobacteraceae bacterium]